MASSKTIRLAGAVAGAFLLLLVLILMFASGSFFLIVLAGLVVVGACVALFLLGLRWHDQRVALRAEEVSGEVDREDPMARIMELRKSFNKGIQHFSSFGKSIYSLPWYMVVGEKEAGKTEAVRHSGLGFPPGLHDEVDGVRTGIGGAGTLNWWFTNHAVMIDTVGEWLFREEEEVDATLSEWGELCRLLASRRPRSPVNGMVLALSAESLLKDSEEETKAKAERLSRRLAQAQQVLEIRFPIFVMVTKCDRIVGFREFFGLAPPEQRQQMLGWSNPSPLDEVFDPNVVEEHLQDFFGTLRRQRLELLGPAPMQEMASKSQSGRVDAVYALPGSLARVVPKLRTYLEAVFLLGEWSTTPLFLRGIYFTSSLQEGPVLDQEVREKFGLPEEVALNGEGEREEEDDLERSYFLHDLFAGKVAQEKGLVLDAGSARSTRRIRRALLWGFGLASVSLLIFLTWLSSYTLQEELGNERGYWETAAEAGQWEELGGRWAWRPVILPAPGGRGQFLYAGTETLDIEGSEFTTGSFLGEIAGRVEKPMRLPWTFRFTARIEGGLSERRLLAARALFESSVLRPLLVAAVDRMAVQTADHWRPEAMDALEQLMRLALAAGDADTGSAGEGLVALDPLFRYVLLSAPADYETYARDHSRAFAAALRKLYDGRRAGAWPPASLDVGGEKARQALRRGVASFTAYWATQVTPGRMSRFFTRASSLATAGEDFLKAEEGLAQLAGGATGATLPADLVGHNMVAGEWGRNFALLSAANEEIRRNEKLLESGTLQEAYQRAGTSAMAEAETAFKRLRGVISLAAAAGGSDAAAEIAELASELDGTVKAQLEALRKTSKRRTTPAHLERLDSRVFAPTGGQAFARKPGRACQYRFETYALAHEQLIARTEARGVFELAQELAGARGAIAGCRASIKKRSEPAEAIPLAGEAARASLFGCDLAERGRTFVLLKGALDNVRDAPGKGRLEDLVGSRAKAKGFAAIQKPGIPLTSAGEGDFDQRYNRKAAAELLAGRETVVSALGMAERDPKKAPGAPGGALLERDELRKEYERLKGAFDGYFVSYLGYWLDTFDASLAVRAPAGGDFFGELTRVVPWKTNKGIGNLVDVVHRALSGFDVAADPVLAARVKSARRGMEAGRETISDKLFLAKCGDIVGKWSEAKDDPDGVRTGILSSKPVGVLQKYTVSGGTAEANAVLRYWQSLTGRALERLAGDFRAAAAKELPRMRALKTFPLAGPAGKSLSPDQIADARRAFDRLRINPRGLPVGAIGRGGKTGVAGLDAALAKLAAYELPGAAGEWLVAADRVLAGLPDAEPLECKVTLLSTDEQNALLDKAGKAYGSHSAARIWRSIALFQGGRARSKPAKTEQLETVPLGKLVYPGREVRFDLHKFSGDPPDKTIRAAGPWACILLLHEHGAKRSGKDGRTWNVGLTLKDDVGRKRTLWLRFTFARGLPALEDWPASVVESALPDRDTGPAGRSPGARADADRLLADARRLRRQGNLEGARGKLTSALAAHPGHAGLSLELADVRAKIAAAADASARTRTAAPKVERPPRPEKDGKETEFGGLMAAATATVDAGRYRQAWKLVGDARKLRPDSPRLKALAGRVIKELAPKQSVKGPLGIELILIRGGTFSMGREDGEPDERPVRRVTVSSYYIGRLEVTLAQFEAYRKKLSDAPARGGKGGSEPVVSVSWDEANRFCKYLSGLDRGKAVFRLPTEAEWEFAARGAEGRKFPWGNEPITPARANVAGGADGYARLAPVGSFPAGATPGGVLDMFGNAGEWCRDWYAPYSADDLSAPRGPARGEQRTARGSAYAFSAKDWPAASTRGNAPPNEKLDTIGLRVIRELTQEEKEFERLARNE